MPVQPRDGDMEQRTQAQFADDVMTAITHAAQPSPTRTFLGAIRVRSLGIALSALVVAWHLGTVRAWPIAPRVRARSFALVMAVAFVLGTGTLAAAAAVTVVVPPWLDQPRLIDQMPSSSAAPSPGHGTRSAPPATHDPSPIPAIVHPAEHPSGGKVAAPPADQTVDAGHASDGDGASSGSGDDDASDDRDDQDSSGPGPADSDDDDGHATDDDHGSETPEPDDHDSSDGNGLDGDGADPDG